MITKLIVLVTEFHFLLCDIKSKEIKKAKLGDTKLNLRWLLGKKIKITSCFKVTVFELQDFNLVNISE